MMLIQNFIIVTIKSFLCVKFSNCLWQPKGDSMWSSAVYDMYDQLTMCILNRNFIF